MQTAYQKWQGLWERRRLTILFGTIYFLLSIFAMTHFLGASYLGERYFKTYYEGMYEGTTYKPFVYRQLIPSLSRAVTAVSPLALQRYVNDRISAMKTNPELQTWRVTMPWMVRAFPVPGQHYPRVISILLIYGCLWGYIWAVGSLARQLFPLSNAMAYIAPIFGVLLISSLSFPFQYVYDIPVLFLTTTCYLFLAQKRWIAYLICFALACLNKETAAFVFVFFLIWFWNRLDRRTYVNLAILQYLIAGGIRLALVYIYQGNEGEYLKNHLFRVLPGDVFTTSQFDRVLVIAWMFFLMTYQWAKKPAFCKYGLWLLPPMYVAYLLYGMPHEYRIFFDVLPLPLMLGVHTLVEGTGLSRSPFFNPNPPSTVTGEVYDTSN